MKTRNKTWRALAVTLMVGGLASASLTQAIAQPPSPTDDGSAPVIDGAASIKPQWTYGEQPAVGSRQPVTAEPKVDRPDTTPCTVQLFTNRKFVPKDGAPPQDYDYTPSAECAGPWSKVVLESDFRVDPEAALYDKTAQLFLGGVTIYYGTTMGPGRYEQNYPYPVYEGSEPKVTPQWHEENDLTEYSALFTEPQDGKVHLDNDAYITSYYTPPDSIKDAGLYMDAKLVFYPVAEGEAAPVVADEVLSLDPETDEGEVVWNDDQSLSYTFDNLPRNLERVYLDVQREGQRGDEFYNTSRNSADGGMGVREFEVKVDGRPAGVVPAYPYKYTYSNGGGYQNRNWAPVPAVSAFNFISYRVDLSPFAGVLSDGQPHTVSVNGHNLPNSPTTRTCVFAKVADRFGDPGCDRGYVLTGGSFWYLTGNLVMYRDHGSETTSGEVTVNTLTPVPNLVVNTTSPRRAVSTHDYVISGYVNTSHGKVVTTLDQKIELDTNVTNSTSTAINQLTEYVARTTVTNGEDTSSTTVNLKYIDQSGVHRADGLNTFGWAYAAEAERNGDPGYWVQISDLYTTVPSSDLAQQRYVAFDSAGQCYDRTLAADITQRKPSIVGVFDDVRCDDPLDVEVTTAFRTLADNAYLSVSAVNNEAAPVDVTLTTPYGSKTFSAVQPGRTVSTVFNARATSVDAGQVGVSLAGSIGGKPITATKNVAYEAFPD
ncbi:peptide-N4-asparagine amidase [Pseudactinotalea sp. HY158]|uniref:peptide-N4-asparagine amidase n=1 Tax=Pseudactinotalea sp. HY158 TaxID=2654547 RepID=UPI00129CA91B|nr:peptide-N4-asparagine amidase [Pseudactinotalea sp. HY158]QGH68299.1 hypothetical protein GCE65_01300 [Pseudactinotalea sp. HY158]